MYTDPIADLLTRIRNGIHADHDLITVPHSKMKENIVKILKDTNIIKDFEITVDEDKKTINIMLEENAPFSTFTRISKPGQRIYIKRTDIRPIKSGLGIAIISTSKGVMTDMEARKQNLGGEIICEIS